MLYWRNWWHSYPHYYIIYVSTSIFYVLINPCKYLSKSTEGSEIWPCLDFRMGSEIRKPNHLKSYLQKVRISNGWISDPHCRWLIVQDLSQAILRKGWMILKPFGDGKWTLPFDIVNMYMLDIGSEKVVLHYLRVANIGQNSY